jgi:intein/homing endonuclease
MTHKKPLFNQGFCWRVESNSKHFVEWYYNNKPSWNDLLNVDEELKIAFIRGVFDGDGSNHKNKQIKISTMRPEFADFLQKMIRIIGFNCNIYKHISTLPSYKKSGIIKYCYDLTILGGKEACHNFLNTINSSIERKRFKIEI